MMKLKSDNPFLQENFEWAVEKTKQFVVTGRKNGEINKGDGGKWYGPEGEIISSPDARWARPRDYKAAFWAGYYDRTAYYIRDFVHQAVGAHLVGLDNELFEMLYTFVTSANESTGWYALWAFNFDHSVYYMDTPNKDRFVREMTAQFELVEICWRLYLWTGDRRYIEDEKISLFIDKIMTDFIDRQDGILLPYKNGIPEGKGDIFQGTSTYNERGFHAVEAGDSIAAMYRAMCCYAKMLEIRGDTENAEKQQKRADALKEYFNRDWSVVDGSDLYCYALGSDGKKHYKWFKNGTEIHGGASLVFIPLKGLGNTGERNNKLLDYIHTVESDENTREDNIESLTYLPEVFFHFHQNDRAWYWMKHILSKKDLPHERESQGTNGDYPEISFTFVSQTVEGLMGIRTNAQRKAFSTCPHFPPDIQNVYIEDILFGGFCVDIELSKESCALTNKSDKTLSWNCCFEGIYESMKVGKNRVKAKSRVDNGVTLSYVTAEVLPKEKILISL